MTTESTRDVGELISGAARCANTERPLTHHSREREGGLPMDGTPNDGRLIFTEEDFVNSVPAIGPPPGKMSNLDWIEQLSDALGIGSYSDVLHFTVIPGAPWSKSRPRFSRNGHTYTKPEDRDAEARTARRLRRMVDEPMTGNVALGCVFFRPNRQRIDTDNLIKHVCDSANGVLWNDDSQCTAVMGVLEMDAENPRTLVVLGRHYSTLTRGSDATYPCAICGKAIAIPGQYSGRDRKRTCSRACAQEYRGFVSLETQVPCPTCGQAFRRTSSYSKFCSRECAVESLRARRRAASTPMSECSTCGKVLDHRRGGRCRDCWRADPSGRLTAEADGRLL